MRSFSGSVLLVGLILASVLCTGAKEIRSVRAKQGMKQYHDEFMGHIEHSLSSLNDTLHRWREHGAGGEGAHEYLSQAAKHSVDTLTHLESLVSKTLGVEQPGRKLRQIYDDTSKEEATKRLEKAKANAENKLLNALGLVKDAARMAVQNTSSELLDTLTERLTSNQLASGGKILSQELETFSMASKLFDLAKGLVPDIQQVGKSSTVAPVAENIVPVPETEPAAPPAVENLAEELTAEEFYRQKASVFDKFDQQVGENEIVAVDGKIMRRLKQVSSVPKDELIANVQSSLEAIRSMTEQGLQVSRSTAEVIRQKGAEARSKYQSMVQSGFERFQGRRLSQDSIIDSNDAGASQFLTFPGEPTTDAFGRATSESREPDEVLDDVFNPYFAGPEYVETTTVVFIPVSNSTDVETLIQDIVGMLVSTLAEAVTAPFLPDIFDSYPGDLSYYESDANIAPTPEEEKSLAWLPYTETTSAIRRRRRLQSLVDHVDSSGAIAFEPYEVTVYAYDPLWFRDARAQNIISTIEDASLDRFFMDDDDSFQISMAIRMNGPEELGGLAPETIEFLGTEDLDMIEEMYRSFLEAESNARLAIGELIPRFSLFNNPVESKTSDKKVQSNEFNPGSDQDTDNLADLIVKKLQNSIYGPSTSDSSNLDLRWFGVMFGIVGMVMMVAVGAFTALRSRPAGYVIMEEPPTATARVPGVQSQENVSTMKPSRKVSNLPA